MYTCFDAYACTVHDLINGSEQPYITQAYMLKVQVTQHTVGAFFCTMYTCIDQMRPEWAEHHNIKLTALSSPGDLKYIL